MVSKNLFARQDLNEGWVGGNAAGFPPCRKLFKTEGFESAVPLAGRAVKFLPGAPNLT